MNSRIKAISFFAVASLAAALLTAIPVARAGEPEPTQEPTTEIPIATTQAPARVRVLFNVNGGKALPASKAAKTVINGKAYGALPAVKRSGYLFLGWYTAKALGKKVAATTTLQVSNDTTSQTLYVHWAKQKVQVKFHINGGKKLAKSKATKNLKYGQKVGALPSPKRSGYTFSGWYTAKSGGERVYTNTKISALNGKQTFYAHWIAKSTGSSSSSGSSGSKYRTVCNTVMERTCVQYTYYPFMQCAQMITIPKQQCSVVPVIGR